MSGSNNKCVSVVIPCYNAESYIQEAIESCFIQPEVAEVIVADDASTDGSVEVVRALQDKYPNLCLIKSDSKEHQGPATMRNRALAQVTQPFVSFLDADDYYLEGRFHTSVDRLLKDLSLDVVYSPAINIRNGYEGVAKFAEKGEILITQKITGIPIEDFILSKTAYGITSILMRMKSLDSMGWFDEELLYGEDTDLHFRILCRLDCEFERDQNKIKICRRVHECNMSHHLRLDVESPKRLIRKNVFVLKHMKSDHAKQRFLSGLLDRIYPQGRWKLLKKFIFMLCLLPKDFKNLSQGIFLLIKEKAQSIGS